MGLEGNLKDFDLTDILQLVHMGKKTGVLEVTGENGTGNIFFQDGVAVHSVCGDASGDDAVNRVLRWRQGSFIFKPDTTSEYRSIKTPLQHLVLEAARQIDEWQDIQKLIPTMEMVLAIEENPSAGTEDIQLQPLEWRVLATVDGARPINQIIKESKLGDFETCKILYGLLSSGLLKVISQGKQAEPAPPPAAPAPKPPPPQPKPVTPQPAPKPEPEKKGMLGLFGKKK
jgi:hypothetical protein